MHLVEMVADGGDGERVMLYCLLEDGGVVESRRCHDGKHGGCGQRDGGMVEE